MDRKMFFCIKSLQSVEYEASIVVYEMSLLIYIYGRNHPRRRLSPSDTQTGRPPAQSEQVSHSKPVPIPNTRHNALFLRDLSKKAQMSYLMSQHLETDTICPPDPQYKENGNHGVSGDIKDSLSTAEHVPNEGENTYASRLLVRGETRLHQSTPEEPVIQSENTDR
ncbi:Hypothetical predicted protein [Pelobates cultripes]|uniref:Uncharacterized protein n=1 Tax=Pelobates cultripes TaxID=61616 RepID=A0AAD1RV78_PELCU|nr:Hypothetical predicted protein [Pelobates cultripes]